MLFLSTCIFHVFFLSCKPCDHHLHFIRKYTTDEALKKNNRKALWGPFCLNGAFNKNRRAKNILTTLWIEKLRNIPLSSLIERANERMNDNLIDKIIMLRRLARDYFQFSWIDGEGRIWKANERKNNLLTIFEHTEKLSRLQTRKALKFSFETSREKSRGTLTVSIWDIRAFLETEKSLYFKEFCLYIHLVST